MAEFHKTGVDIPALVRFDKFMKAYMDQNGVKPIRGAVLAITSGDRLVFARGYVRDKKADGVMPPTSLFRIASASKPITGIAVTQLLEQGVLDEADKVAPIVGLKRPGGTAFKIEPKPDNPSTAGNYFHEVNVRHCLLHKTGMHKTIAAQDVAIAKSFQPAGQEDAFKLPVNKYQVASWALDQGFHFWPGSKVDYCNVEYSVLGMVIEKKAHRGYVTAVQHTVFGPIGVTRARGARSLESQRAPGEVAYHAIADTDKDKPSVLDNKQNIVAIPYGGENFENKDSYGGLVLSAVDYARVLASFNSPQPLVTTPFDKLLFWWNGPKPKTGAGVKAYRHGAVVPGSAGVVGLRLDGFSISLFINTTKGNTEKYIFKFEGSTFNQDSADDGHELTLYKIIEEMKARAWPTHDLFPLHGVPANVTDVVALENGALALAVRGADQELHVRTHSPKTGWAEWEDWGGALVTPPRSVTWGSDHLDIFALGLDRALWHRERLPGKSSGKWKSLGGDLESEPCAVSSKPNRVDVFAVGKDHDLRHYWRHEKTGWGGEESLDGFLTTPPSAVAWEPDRLDIFALDANYALQHLWHDPKKGWGKWESLGGDLRSYPEAISWGKGRLDIFALGTDRSLMHLWHDAKTGWGKWESLGGDLRCSPTVSSWGANRLDVFAVTAKQELTHISFAGSQGWSKWETLGGTLSSRPKAVSRSQGHIDVLAAGRDQNVRHISHGAGGWGAWKSIGGEVG